MIQASVASPASETATSAIRGSPRVPTTVRAGPNGLSALRIDAWRTDARTTRAPGAPRTHATTASPLSPSVRATGPEVAPGAASRAGPPHAPKRPRSATQTAPSPVVHDATPSRWRLRATAAEAAPVASTSGGDQEPSSRRDAVPFDDTTSSPAAVRAQPMRSPLGFWTTVVSPAGNPEADGGCHPAANGRWAERSRAPSANTTCATPSPRTPAPRRTPAPLRSGAWSHAMAGRYPRGPRGAGAGCGS